MLGGSGSARDLDLERPRLDDRRLGFLEFWRDLDLVFCFDEPADLETLVSGARLFVATFLGAAARQVVLLPRFEAFLPLTDLVGARLRGLDNPFFVDSFFTDLPFDLDLIILLRDRAIFDEDLERELFLVAE